MRIHARLHGGQRGFDGRNSRFYDFMATRLLRRVYRRLARDAAALAGDGATVLDIGTGPGVLLVELATLRPDLRVTGVDPSADMVAAARRKLTGFGDRADAAVGEAARLPFPDGSFDLVLSSLSLHHWQRPADAAPELRRVLRPGGKVCVYDFRSAPFDALVTPGDRQTRTKVRSGIPFAPALTRLVVTP
jgi:ubiquinone/menaquinone biosynthesis C-methylase UbiE